MVKRRKAASVAGLLAATAFISSPAISQASAIIGQWTNGTTDGWINWHTDSGYSGGPSSLPTPTYTYAVDGNVPGDPTGDSLLYTKSGYYQGPAIKLEYTAGDVKDFMENNAIQLNITFPAAGGHTQGYWQIYQVFVNAPSWGFTQINATNPAANQYYYSGFPQTAETFTFSYQNALTALHNAGYSVSNLPGYVEIIFALNNGSGAPKDAYLDQVSLVTVPEPASLSMLGLAAAGLMARRRRLRR